MSNLTQRQNAVQLAEAPHEPVLSGGLRANVFAMENPVLPSQVPGEAGMRMEPIPLTPEQSREADQAVAAYDAMLRPVRPLAVVQWLRGINVGVANTLGQEDFAMKAAAIANACADLPEASFTTESQRLAMQSFRWFPSAAEVVALLKPEAMTWRRRAAMLRAMPREAPPRPRVARPDPSLAEREYVAGRVADVTAALRLGDSALRRTMRRVEQSAHSDRGRP